MLTGIRLFCILTSFFIFQTPLSAQDLNVDPLSNFSITKDEIFKSLENLKNEGKISDADYKKTKDELNGMSDSQVNSIKDKAVNIIRKDPDKAVDLVKGKSIDLKEVEKQAAEANPGK